MKGLVDFLMRFFMHYYAKICVSAVKFSFFQDFWSKFSTVCVRAHATKQNKPITGQCFACFSEERWSVIGRFVLDDLKMIAFSLVGKRVRWSRKSKDNFSLVGVCEHTSTINSLHYLQRPIVEAFDISVLCVVTLIYWQKCNASIFNWPCYLRTRHVDYYFVCV